ncbi:BCD family MFS transporter [Novosphingobium taihuense]|uniref:BCD family chlorophyll transporter-like MFS transporter n=1 Tax=Novosphingobium taihuense TaxID=260085 RepID=A0A7W7A9S3_9SPHN|nr:BCD family MFS transporter [Novosphingobium taihuense]MBB4612297.1 BCD family chlorophyll transporter-like MFS transporter [Novosphingobium taihuense]TWH88349.1 BCD family chlorophyll transporter-like MFS transporter [Novosphingobium taihuense]
MNGRFGWWSIVRLGAVQASIGAMVMVATSLLNRLMVLEYGLAAGVPAGLVAWHYMVQLSRPLWGHGSDLGRRRTPFVIGGMAILGAGTMLAVQGTTMLDDSRTLGIALAVLAFSLIGAGVGAAGTSMLAILATGVAPEKRAAAAATTWIMMVFGIVISAGTAGALLDPYSEQRLLMVSGGVVAAAITVTCLAMLGLEARAGAAMAPETREPPASLREAIAEILGDPQSRRFTLFIFVSMLAYSMQDLILEPFAGLVFQMSPGQSTSLSGVQHGGVLVGMIVTGLGGSAFAGRMPIELRVWTMLGCIGSALALTGLALAAKAGPGWPLAANIAALGFFNGAFAVSAIGSMMGLAGAGKRTREGVRMGVWGTAQAIAFGLGGLTGALGVDLARSATGQVTESFQLIFALEASLFMVSAVLAMRVTNRRSAAARFGTAGI